MATKMEDSNNPTPEIPRQRRFFRGLGNTASGASIETIAIAEPLIDSEIESNPIPFHLEERLADYQKLWEKHKSCLEDSLSDIDLRDDFSSVLNAYLAGLPNATRDTKAGIARLNSDGGFDKIVKISFGVGRLHSTRHDRIILNSGGNFIDQVNNLLPQAKEWERVRKKLLYLFDPNNLRVAPLIAPKVHARLVDIYDGARETYKPIYKLENDITYAIMRELQKNPNSAIELLDSFLECSDSEIGVEKTFARFLANNYELYGNQSELSQALGLIEEFATTNTFANGFLKTQLDEKNGDNLTAFLAAKGWSSETEFLRFMKEAFNDWPDDYRQIYRLYIEKEFKDYPNNIHKQVQSVKHKAWMMTDLNSVEEDVDRLWDILYPNHLKQVDRTTHK